MPRLFFGGSFNPIHHGHLLCARAAAETLGYSRVSLIPAGQAPHKAASANVADAGHRLAMVVKSVAGDPLFDVCDIEISRAGPSYTIDTARRLIASGEKEVHWLIGADMLLYLPRWHLPDDLLREVNFIIIARPGWSLDWNMMPPAFQKLQKNVVEVPLIAISSTDIRARVAGGKTIRYMTPDAVCDYIAENRLYR